MDPRGRSAIVTGGAGGLGAATARRLVAAGMRVVVLDRAAERARAVVADLGPQAVTVAGDVNDDGDVAAAIDAAQPLGALSVLVGTAGGGTGGGPTVSADGAPHDRDSFTATMEMNALGTFNVARLVAAAMRANAPDADGQRGVVVHTASVAGFEGQRGQVAYAAAKAAILGMTLPMARDLAPLGIRVCAVAPGPMGTPIMRRVMDRLDADPTEGIVFPPRMGEPDEFALLVESIVRNPYLNGESIRLDGALRLGGG
ncbi:MAG TPA: SDR family NAD(P)-dependent oxidoreductase [Acidimicrobiales bacterium]|nr:SDR family NAD(P)-dependent oxidoreductase [Acidimicrobiales bacterium]